MTHDEIIKQLESLLSHCKSMIEKDGGFPIWEKDCEALKAAIAALRPSGEPLTLEQLKEMDGQPVWIVGITHKWLSPCWAIVDRDNCLVRTARNGSPVFFESYGRTWLAYAYPPIDRDKWTPCRFCSNADFGEYGFEFGKKYAKIACALGSWRFPEDEQFQFCPECGRPLTEEAWAELEKRLRG